MTDPEVTSTGTVPTSKKGLTRYMAPEQIDPTQFGREHGDPPLKESDVHSFAMTTYEVCFPASFVGTAENLQPLPGPHQDQAIRRHDRRRRSHAPHCGQKGPPALPNGWDSGSLVSRINLGCGEVLLEGGAVVAVAHCRSV